MINQSFTLKCNPIARALQLDRAHEIEVREFKISQYRPKSLILDGVREILRIFLHTSPEGATGLTVPARETGHYA